MRSREEAGANNCITSRNRTLADLAVGYSP